VRPHLGSSLGMLALTLLAVSCSFTGQALSPSPTSPPPPSAPAIPSPTPTPVLLFLSTTRGSALEEALGAWASARGWGVDSGLAGEADVAGLLAEPGLQAVVVEGAEPSSSGLAVNWPVLPVVVVDRENAAPGARTSVVGEPGARHDEAGFLAGALAGLISRTGMVGLITETGGRSDPVYIAAFVHGARYGCPGCGVVTLPAGEGTAEGMAAEGADVVFAVPGPEANSSLSRMAEAGLWIVWAGETPPAVPAEQVAGGVAFAPEALVPQALEALLAGGLGRAWPYSVANGGVRLAGLNPAAVSPGRQRILEAAVEALAIGELDIGVDPVTGEER